MKHGVADQVEGGTVRIAARRRGDRWMVEVENSRDPEAPPRRGAGMGLDNVRRRLEAIAADQGRLAIDRAERSFRVTLTLPANSRRPDERIAQAAATVRAVIVDDEAPARSLVREYLGAHSDIEIVGECANGFEAVKRIGERSPTWCCSTSRCRSWTASRCWSCSTHSPPWCS